MLRITLQWRFLFHKKSHERSPKNIPILPMAFLTFAEAKVVAPPILRRE